MTCRIISIEIAPSLTAAIDGAWEEWKTVTIQGAFSEGYSQRAGSVNILEPLGNQVIVVESADEETGETVYTTQTVNLAWTLRHGQIVRIGAASSDVDLVDRYRWYRVQGQTLGTIAGEGGKMIDTITYACLGLACVFADCTPTQMPTLKGDALLIVDQAPLAINDTIGEGIIRPTNTQADSAQAWGYEPLLSDDWTPGLFLTYLAEQYERETGTELVLTINTDAQAVLDESVLAERTSLIGKTYLDAFGAVLNNGRGLGFTVGIDAGKLELLIYLSGGYEVLIDDAGAVTTTPRTGAEIVAEDDEVSSYSLQALSANQADRIICHGEPLWWLITLRAESDLEESQLVPAWDTSLETAWEDDTENPQYADVYRRFRLTADWDGYGRVPGFGVWNSRTVTAGNWQGDMTHDEAEQPDGQAFIFTDSLPIRTDEDWTQAPGEIVTLRPDNPYRAPELYIGIVSGTSVVYERAAESFGYDVTVTPSADGSSIIVHPLEVAIDIKAQLDAGNELHFTLGLESPYHLAVDYNRSPDVGDIPSMDRTLIVQVPGARRAVLLPGSILDADGTDTPPASASLVATIDDGIQQLRDRLQFEVGRRLDPDYNMTLRFPNYTEAYNVGDLVQSFTTGGGTRIDFSGTIQSVQHVPGGGTTITVGTAPASGTIRP